MCYQCPVCGSTNCEERDRCITCLDCSTQFKVWMVKEGRKPIPPGLNYTEKQVDD
jgi:hypothetical protein